MQKGNPKLKNCVESRKLMHLRPSNKSAAPIAAPQMSGPRTTIARAASRHATPAAKSMNIEYARTYHMGCITGLFKLLARIASAPMFGAMPITYRPLRFRVLDARSDSSRLAAVPKMRLKHIIIRYHVKNAGRQTFGRIATISLELKPSAMHAELRLVSTLKVSDLCQRDIPLLPYLYLK